MYRNSIQLYRNVQTSVKELEVMDRSCILWHITYGVAVPATNIGLCKYFTFFTRGVDSSRMK